MMIKRLSRWGAIVLIILVLSACSPVSFVPAHTPSALTPHGAGAASIASLWWVMLGFGTAAWVLVVALMFAALLRRRRSTSATAPDSADGDTGRNWTILGGMVMPLIVLGIVFGYNIYTLAKVENPNEKAPMEIKVIGRRWWWEVQYPAQDQQITTANEIHIPVGVPVQLELQSADVIHSFWVPELHGKMDLIPTRINKLILKANDIGVYRGQCAEFCGLQHAHMGFMVIVESRADFDKWVSAQQQPAVVPTDQTAQRGQQVFMSDGCVFCHTVQGLDDKQIDRSSVDLGPDLTHIASRMTIAGASLQENRGNLAGWILDPQHVKPGALMPEMDINSQDLQDLLVYLETLK